MGRLVAGVCAVLVALSACSSDDPESCCANTEPYYARLIADAVTVVVADLVDDGSTSGEVAIRPTMFLRGGLAVDAEGLYRFRWDDVDPTLNGVWLFDAGGRPMNDPFVDPPVYPCNDSHLSYEFPDATSEESARVIGTADLVVAVTRVEDTDVFDAGDGAVTMQVVEVFSEEGPAVGERITFTPPPDHIPGGLGAVSIWALQQTNGRWTAVPSWFSSGWEDRPAIRQTIDEVLSGL